MIILYTKFDVSISDSSYGSLKVHLNFGWLVSCVAIIPRYSEILVENCGLYLPTCMWRPRRGWLQDFTKISANRKL